MYRRRVAANLRDALAGGGPASVSDAVARMRAIQDALPATNGVAHFNRLYLAVTEAVEAGLAGGDRFGDPGFVARLDVAFAGLYFDALRAHAGDPIGAPRAWAPLFAAAETRGIAPLQFAIAGMNAHINRDLPVALAATWQEPTGVPPRGGPQHSDFVRVNAQLAVIAERVKESYLSGVLGFLDRVLGRVDDAVAMWNVVRARDAAWTNGEALWRLRRDPALAREFLTALDRTVGLAGRGLLQPAHRVPLPRRLRAARFLRLVERL